MLIKEAIKLILAEDVGIAALVGKRIFPLRLPQKGDFPAIAWGRVARDPDEVLSDEKPQSLLIIDEFEFISMAEGSGGEAVSEDIDDALFERMHGFRGVVYSDASPSDTLTILKIKLIKLTEHYRDDLQQYATRSVYRVHFVRKQRPPL